jgi:cytochrome c oxidase subunit III
MSQIMTDQTLSPAPTVASLTRAGWGRLAMWLFLASDGMTFAGLLTGYAVLRTHNTDWPSPANHLALTLGIVMTVLLLGSSVTMLKAHTAVKNENRQQFSFFMLLTIGAGVAFLLLQGYEWRHLLHQGMTMSGNPWGAPLFGATFYTLTGFHGLHVFAGVLYLLMILFKGRKKEKLITNDESVAILGLYWHFVDIVWVFVFTSVYLL